MIRDREVLSLIIPIRVDGSINIHGIKRNAYNDRYLNHTVVLYDIGKVVEILKEKYANR